MDSRTIKVRVVRDGREIKRIERPLRQIDGKPAVVYRGNLYPLLAGDVINVSQPSLDPVKSEPRMVAMPSLPIPVPVVDGVPKWDTDQLAVIQGAPEARLLVDAGPGTGKTAVACARVAWLISECGITPSNIWLISFTRTAVREIRNRLRTYLKGGGEAASVHIATLDSYAWQIYHGFESQAEPPGSYDENISDVVKLIRTHEGVFEYLSSIEHVLIDEAQDVGGVRAELIDTLLEQLGSGCGITVFADEAQAIYGFAEERKASGDKPGNLLTVLRSTDPPFSSVILRDVKRTSTPRLRQVFTDVRQVVLDSRRHINTAHFDHVRERISELVDIRDAEMKTAVPPDIDPSTLVLFRGRADALTAASFRGLLHYRLRMSGYPALIEPWVAAVFWSWQDKGMHRSDFERLVSALKDGTKLVPDPQRAWTVLVRLAGESKSTISVHRLRRVLSRQSPPLEACRAEFGLGGPIFGTIHGSKGREADSVVLMLPKSQSLGTDADIDEETRVLFVGATRARHRLITVKPYSVRFAGSTQSGRAFILRSGGYRAQVEIGRSGDITADGLVGISTFATPDDAGSAQKWLQDYSGELQMAIAISGSDFGYRVSREKDTPTLAVLNNQVNKDLFEIGRRIASNHPGVNLRPNGAIPYIRIFGARSVVVAPDDKRFDLHEPWATSGFMLAPVVQAFTMVSFRKY